MYLLCEIPKFKHVKIVKWITKSKSSEHTFFFHYILSHAFAGFIQGFIASEDISDLERSNY